jgi:hypothetical protein
MSYSKQVSMSADNISDQLVFGSGRRASNISNNRLDGGLANAMIFSSIPMVRTVIFQASRMALRNLNTTQ